MHDVKMAEAQGLIELSRDLNMAMDILQREFESFDNPEDHLDEMQAINVGIRTLLTASKAATANAKVLVEEIKRDGFVPF